jgi:hypothetical protein
MYDEAWNRMVSGSRWNLSLLDNRRDIFRLLELVGFESACPCKYD